MAGSADAHGAGGAGFVHELGLYRSGGELLDLVVPFVRGGLAAGAPTLLMCGPALTAAVIDAVPSSPLLTVLPARVPRRPAADLAAFPATLAAHGVAGARTRVVNEMPGPTAPDWHEWRRYEAAVNSILSPHDVWGLCLYDRRALADGAAEDLYATHPLLGDGRGHRPSGSYVDPARFLDAHLDAPRDPVESTVPVVELADPSPAAARAAVVGFGARAGLAGDGLDDVVYAANEAVTNALTHGVPPVTVRLWSAPDRLTVTVTDRGPGPTDPFVGLVPGGAGPGRRGVPGARQGDGHGVGLWMSHQLVDVTHRRDADGYTVRLHAGADHAAGPPTTEGGSP